MGMDSVFKVSLVLDMIDNMSDKVNAVSDTVSGGVGAITGAFESIQKAGLAMTGTGTAITTACLGTVTATFDTQNALAELSSLGVEDLKAVESAAKDFSDTWAGTAKSDFITAAYDIKSGIASLSDEGVAKFTELAALTGKATKSTTEEMGSLFATGYGIYKDFYGEMSDMEFGEMFSAGISTAVKAYKTSGSEMADAIGKLGATATNANVPMEEQLAILGQLQTTMSGSEAATKYNAFLQSAAGAGKKLGLTFTDANNQLLSTPEILDALKSKYGDTLDAVEKQELKDAFGTDEAIKYIDLLYGKTDELRGGISDLHDSMQNGISTTEQMAEAINNTPEQKFEVLKQKVHNTVEELGSGLLPAVNKSLDAVNNLVQKGSDWVANNQETVSTLMNIVLYLGIFLIAAGVLTTAIGTAGKAMTGFTSVFRLAKTAMSGSGFLAALGPIAAIAAAVIGLIAIFQACGGDVSQLQGMIRSAFGSVGSIVSQALGAAAAYLPGFLEFGGQLLSSIVSGIVQNLPGLLSSGSQMIESVSSGIAQALPGIGTRGAEMLTCLLSVILSGMPALMSAGGNLIVSLLSGIGMVLPSVAEMASQLLLGFLSAIVSGLPGLVSAGSGMITSILSGIIQLLPTILQSGATLVINLLSGIAQLLPVTVQSGITLVLQLLSGIAQNLPALLSAGGQMIMTLLSGIIQLLPTILSEGLSIVGNIVSGILQGIPSLVSIGGDIVSSVWSAIRDTDWIAIGGDMISGIADGFMEGFHSLVDSVKGAWDSFTSWLSGGGDNEPIEVTTSTSASTAPQTVPTVQPSAQTEVPATMTVIPDIQMDTSKYQQSGLEGMQAFTDGLKAGTGDAQTTMDALNADLKETLSGSGLDVENLGLDLTGGLADGIESGTGDIQTAAEKAAAGLTDTLSGNEAGTGLGADLMSSLANGIEMNSGAAEAAAGGSMDNILSSISVDTSQASAVGNDIMSSVGNGISANAESTATAAQKTINDAMASIGTIDTGSVGSDIMGSIGNGIDSSSGIAATAAQNASGSITDAFDIDASALSGGVTQAAGTITTTVDSLSVNVRSKMEACWNNVSRATQYSMSAITSATRSGTSAIVSAWRSGMSNVSSAVASGMSHVRSTAVGQASSIASQIRAAFANIHVTVPAPKLPHVSVSYSSVGVGEATAQVPHFSVSYYARGGIMTRPTAFAYDLAGGKKLVGGEAGAEAILPLDTLWVKMREVVGNVIQSGSEKTDDTGSIKNKISATISSKVKSLKSGETAKKSKAGSGKEKKYYIEKFIVNADMSDSDSISRLMKLLDELDSPETAPEPA